LKKVILSTQKYNTVCFICSKEIPIYFTNPNDLGIIKKCKVCDTLYLYYLYQDKHIQPVEKQLEGKLCINCHQDLNKTLVSTFTNIKCCSTSFTLDDDFDISYNLDADNKEDVEVFLIYENI